MPRNIPSVALLVETSTSWGAGIVEGVARYSQEHGPWHFFAEPRGRYERLLLPSEWKGDGIIARVNHAKLAESIRKATVPTINVSWFDCGEGIPRVSTDEVKTGEIAAQHFIERGFTSFAYCGPFDRPGYTDQICCGYLKELSRHHLECEVFAPKGKSLHGWGAQRKVLGDWLSRLPKPVALLTWNDVNGRLITETCLYRGLRVPEEIAILTGEHDALSNDLSYPPLSTIDHSPELVGYEAARILHRMMRGDKPPAKPVLLRNLRIIPKRSSDVMAISDKDLADAIGYMRQNAHSGINVKDVLRKFPMGRRMFEIRCKEILGRSPAEEIRRQRIEHAKSLLVNTRLPISKVAKLSGFRDVNVFGRRFRAEVGATPTAYRKSSGLL